MSELSVFNRDLLSFIQQSPTPYHAVFNMEEALLSAGFVKLLESDSWNLHVGGRYFFCRDGSIVAWVCGEKLPIEKGLRIVGAHTDSPCLKVKPVADIRQAGVGQLSVAVYGGVLLNPWFDRDLGLAGRLNYVDKQGGAHNLLINIERPMAFIPSLAIHLDREANQSRSVNAQNDINPIIWQDGQKSLEAFLLAQLQQQNAEAQIITSYDLSLYDIQAPALVGEAKDFIASARLDNLLSCYTGLQALLNADGSRSVVLACYDHEEVGSVSHTGAQGTMLQCLLDRWLPEADICQRVLSQSWLISADNAHALHPNYVAKHDGQHAPLLNGGPVVKVNHNQRYATTDEGIALFKSLAQSVDVSVQPFVVRNDMGCGSTIGPFVASQLGIRTIDAGVPSLGMHSIREFVGARDAYSLCKVLSKFFA